MESGKKENTFLWYIENYSYCYHRNGEALASPTFRVDGLKGTAWNLELFPRGMEDEHKGHVSLLLHRSASSDGPKRYSVEFELSVLASDGSTLVSEQGEDTFEKEEWSGCLEFLKVDEILFQKKANYLPRDTLTVRCTIWKGGGNVHSIGQSSARTRIKVEKISFLHVVENFSALEGRQKKTKEIRSPSNKEHFLSSSLLASDCLWCDGKIVFEIVPSNADQILRKCDVYALDASGNAKGCGKADNRYGDECKGIDRIPLSLTRAEVLNRNSEYLKDDKLSLLCMCHFSNGIEFQTIEETLHQMHFALMQKANDLSRKSREDAKNGSNYPSVAEDLKALYIDKALTDVQLETNTKSFSAHKMVLCARSPVFKQMLTSNMKEKNSGSIRIDDVGEDVMQQLLLFLYSDTVEDLDWRMATRLFYAADKYDVGKLKEVCSSFLLENLTPANVGELFLLADTHSDANLLREVEDFILEHEEDVFGSDEWEKLMDTDPLLVVKAMYVKYRRKKSKAN